MKKIEPNGKEADVFRDGLYIYKQFNNINFGKRSANVEALVLSFLNKHFYPAPKYFGKFTYEDRACVKMSFEGETTLEDDLYYDKEHGKFVGEKLAELHLRLHKIPIDSELNDLPKANDLFHQSANKYGFSEVLTSLLNTKLVLAHGDFHPANVIDRGDRQVVIDWSRAFIGPAEADIARTLVTLRLFLPPSEATDSEKTTLQENLNETEESYLKEYCSNVKLERDSVKSWMQLVAMSFSSNNTKNNEIITGKFELAWPD